MYLVMYIRIYYAVILAKFRFDCGSVRSECVYKDVFLTFIPGDVTWSRQKLSRLASESMLKMIFGGRIGTYASEDGEHDLKSHRELTFKVLRKFAVLEKCVS